MNNVRDEELSDRIKAMRAEERRLKVVADAPPQKLLSWLNIAAWQGKEIPKRQWAIRDRVPLKQAGLFSGEGGTGKSILELMKNVAYVSGKDWLGSMPEPGPAF